MTERFGLISYSDELPELGGLRELIGTDAAVYEEFDTLDSETP